MPTQDKFKFTAINLSTAIEKIYGLKTNNETDKILQIVSSTFTELLHIDLYKFLETEPANFIAEITNNNYNTSILNSIARLLTEAAEVFQMQGNKKFVKHLNLLELLLLKHLNDTDKTYSTQREEKIALLESAVKK